MRAASDFSAHPFRLPVQFLTVKVTVVGAGVIGCAVAYELARRGARVHVVDPRTPGQGATRASAGILAPYIEGHVPSLLKLGVRSLAPVRRLRAPRRRRRRHRHRIRALRHAPGGGRRRRDHPPGRAGARARAGAGGRTAFRQERSARDRARPLAAACTARCSSPRTATWRPHSLVAALVAAATRLGVVFETATVTQVGSAAAGACVHTSNGRIEGDAAVMAAGSWSPLIPVRAGSKRRRRERQARGASGARTARAARSGGAGGASRRVGARLLRGAAARRVGAGGRHGGERRVRRASHRRRRARAAQRGHDLVPRARERRVRGRPRRPPSRAPTTSCPSSAVRRPCRACSTPPGTSATACCWRR